MTSAIPPLRILYLEDNQVDADFTRLVLARTAPGMVLEVAVTMSAALDLLAPPSPPFDVVLTDLRLPDGSGMELLAHIRRRELPLAVVIITGNGDLDTAVAALKAGADDYLIKGGANTVDLPGVLAAAWDSFRKRREHRARRLHVLYAEPNPADVDLTRRYLARHASHIGLEVVGSGEEVLALLPETAGKALHPFDVLLLDYRLPGLNALEVIKAIRRERGLDLPIVLVTGHGTEDVAIQALRLGVDDYLTKDDGYLQKLPIVLEKLQKQAELNANEKAYRRLSNEFNGLLDAIPDSLMLLDRDLNILWANRAASERIDEPPENPSDRHCHSHCCNSDIPCDPCPVLRCFETGMPIEETVARGGDRTWNVRTVPLKDEQEQTSKAIVLMRDITDHKKLELQYLHAQKMESIGTLAGGVAHDFNNILTVIVGLGHLMQMDMTPGDPHWRHVSGIMEAVERATHLTRQLLLFSRKHQGTRNPVDLNEIVGRMEKFLCRIIGEDITLRKVPHETPLSVLADVTQLEQVLMNLAVNSRDAMPHGGEFVLRTEKAVLDEGFAAKHGWGKPGPYALLTVSDSGSGMDQATLQRIFEPFFSTKEVGKGTGLGLAVVYGIIKEHDGFITVYSEPGQGACFRIYLPLSGQALQETGASRREPVVGGTETILLAEDEEMVRKLVATVLTEAGYRVITAADGGEAVRRFREHADSIRLLLFDLIMPGMNGKEASDEIHGMRPGVRTIFTSGYSPDIAMRKASLQDGSHLVIKPVLPTDLLRKVRSVLDGAP